MTESKISIRDAVPQDLEQITEIWRYYVSNSIANLEENIPTKEEVGKDLDNMFSNESYPFIVAVEDSNICGYGYVGPFNQRSGYKFCCEDSIYIQPQYTRKGLGKRMLGILIQRLREDGKLTQVLAKTSVPPESALEDSASCQLHISLGFKEVGRLKKVGWKFGGWLDVVILQLDLRESR